MNFLQIIKNVRTITDRNDKISIVLISFLIFFGLILEVVGIAMIIPILTILTSDIDSSFISLLFIENLANKLGFSNLLTFLLFVMLLIYLFKSTYVVYLSYKEKSFISNFIKNVVNRLFLRYGSQNYKYFIKKNSSSIVQILQSESYYLFLFFENLILITSEVLLIGLMMIFLIMYDINLFLFASTFFGILMLIFFIVTKSKFYEWGKKRVDYDQTISKLILETFGSIKEVLIYDTLSFFNKKIQSLNDSKYNLFTYKLTLNNIPKTYFELSTVIFLISYIYYLNGLDYNISNIILNLGVLVAASYKVIPSLTKVSNSVQNLKNYSSSLELIVKEFQDTTKQSDDRSRISGFDNNIEFKDLTYRYQDESNKTVIDKLSFKISKNETIGIIGESGSGKTTFLDIFAGLLEISGGKIIVDNNEVNFKEKFWKPDIGYVSQKTFIINDSIKNNISFSDLQTNVDNDKIITSIENARISTWIDSLKSKVNTMISQDGLNISGGQAQRIGIARALYKNSDIIIFDEPTSSLDNTTEKQIMDTIYSLKDKTIIIVSHKHSNLKRCDKLIEIK
jgi:ATP-binding cassette, subfamily B, bacterial PglK